MKSSAAQHLKRAEHFLIVSSDPLKLGHYSDSISRSYYGAFHSKGYSFRDGFESKITSGCLVGLRGARHESRSLDRRFHQDGWALFNRRLEADYMVDAEESREDAEELLGFAKELLTACPTLLVRR